MGPIGSTEKSAA